MEDLWPLIRGKLNQIKMPPYPPELTGQRATSGCLGKMHQLPNRRSMIERKLNGGRQRQSSENPVLSGFLTNTKQVLDTNAAHMVLWYSGSTLCSYVLRTRRDRRCRNALAL